MTWFRVDDNLAFHAKVVVAGNAAMGLWVRAGSWSSQQLTDGFIPDHMIATLGNRAQARALVKSGLWIEEEGGCRFWQWEPRNPTRASVEEDREAARERMAKRRRGKRGEFGGSSPEHSENGEGTSASVRPPRPVPSLVVNSSPSQSRDVTGADQDDLDSIINILAGLRPRQPIPADHARQVLADIGSRMPENVRSRQAYIAECIRKEPDRYLPTFVPPPFRPPRNPTGPPADPSAAAKARDLYRRTRHQPEEVTA